ncbi:MAG: DUF6382 domain-containing protein, partial [bacterium]
MDAVFERNLDQVSLILKDSAAVEADGFETKMACVGGVPGLLPMSVRQVNGETAYVYEVTARQPLSEYLKGRALSASELAEILKTVLGILEGLETYLLDPGHILFSADRIFAQGSFRELWLCYVPSHSRPMREGLYGLTMELLSNVDQKDRDAIVLGYRFAHELQEENTSFGDLRACLCGRYKEAEALFEAGKYEDALELLLIAVDPEYRNKGVHVMLFNELIPQLIKNGFKYGESNAEMESNTSVQNLWNQYRKEFKRRRRVFSKEI